MVKGSSHILSWQDLSDSQLMKAQLCHLKLSIDGSWLEPYLQSVVSELTRRGLNFKPHFWVSDEWFCPDGISGVAIPFYLLHPRLVSLEKKYIGYAEGERKSEFIKILRHELGHAFENAYRLRSQHLRIQTFGNSKLHKYPSNYIPKPYSKKYVDHLGEGYAQSHPDEDFAETFAVWLTPRSRWKEKYKNWPAYKKLLAMEQIVSLVKNKNPLLQNKYTSGCIKKNRMTLGQYFSEKRKRLRVSDKYYFDQSLKSIFVVERGPFKSTRAHQFILKNKRHMGNVVAEAIGERKYQVEQVLVAMAKRSRELDLSVKKEDSKLKREFLDYLTRETLEHLTQKRDRIYM